MTRPASRRPRRVILTLLWTLAAWLVVIPGASAYIDPGTTTIFFQAVIAGLAAAGTAVTVFWSRIVGFFRRDTDVTDTQ